MCLANDCLIKSLFLAVFLRVSCLIKSSIDAIMVEMDNLWITTLEISKDLSKMQSSSVEMV